MVVTQLEALETYCAVVSRQCKRFDFDGKRLALQALDIQVTANGRKWHLQGRIPMDDAGVMTRTSEGKTVSIPPWDTTYSRQSLSRRRAYEWETPCSRYCFKRCKPS
jgi:hypothetical protein